MKDTIYRQEAIDSVNAYLGLSAVSRTVQNMTSIQEILEKLPSAQSEWIPCSERLPEVGQSVLISVGGIYVAEGCLRWDGDWVQFRWDAIHRKDMVGAWKPLGEPWRGEEHD